MSIKIIDVCVFNHSKTERHQILSRVTKHYLMKPFLSYYISLL